MRFIWIVLCVYFFAVQSSDQKSTPEGSDYVAAVVEFQLTENSSIALNEYVDYIKKAAEKDADIVVFPEMTLLRKSEHVNVPIHGLLLTYPVPALHPELYDEVFYTIPNAQPVMCVKDESGEGGDVRADSKLRFVECSIQSIKRTAYEAYFGSKIKVGQNLFTLHIAGGAAGTLYNSGELCALPKPLVSISKAARDHEIYVVINVQEQMDCHDAAQEYCPEKKVYRFNTNVVFDRNGAVIDRYRKINPFGEATRSPALKRDLGVFSTDFGVKFGHFICFDIMFQVPAVQVVSKFKIKNIVFPTMWFSEMPYLTAVETQQAYAYAMDVNLLAANANNIKVGTAGSGIFSGKYGPLVSIMAGVAGTRMLVAKVPKTPGEVDKTYVYPGPIFDNPADPDDLLLNKDLTLPTRTSKILTTGYQVFTIEDNDVKCKISATLKHLNSEKTHKYRAFVHHGTNTYSKRQIGVAVCSVVACESDDVKSCPHRFKNDMNLQFEQLKIEMTTVRASYNESLHCQNIEYFPVSLRINKFPLDSTNFTYIEETINTGHELITYELIAPQNDLITLGVWGRVFDKDDPPEEDVTEEDINNYLAIENIIYEDSEGTVVKKK